MKISLYGPFPPNTGGVSTHVKNLASNLNRDGFLNNVYINNGIKVISDYPSYCIDIFHSGGKCRCLGRFIPLFRLLAKDCADIVHIHGSIFTDLISAFYIIFFLKKKVVFTIHDQMQLQRVFAKWILFRFFLMIISGTDKINFVVVNKIIYKQLCEIGVTCKQISIVPAYISHDFENGDFLEEELISFKQKFDIMLSVYACHLNLSDTQKDIYGIDIALKALSIVAKNVSVSVGMIVCVPGVISESVNILYNNIVAQMGISDHVLIYNKPLRNPLYFWKKSDLYIRPTLTDGDSIAVREALNLGTVVIASDVVSRPDSCLTFKSEDILDLSDKILYSINHLKQLKEDGAKINSDYYLDLMDIYNDLLSNE